MVTQRNAYSVRFWITVLLQDSNMCLFIAKSCFAKDNKYFSYESRKEGRKEGIKKGRKKERQDKDAFQA